MEVENVNIKNWKSLIKPSKLDVKISEDQTKATIIAEPLEKGYGLTLGNSLRRILLSSIRGTAVTSIQIDGVLHEFTSIKGVREDVTDIVLNIKSLALKSHSEGTKKLVLDAKGPGEIKASDITTVADIEILNPDLVICNLDENTNFHMELFSPYPGGPFRYLICMLLRDTKFFRSAWSQKIEENSTYVQVLRSSLTNQKA